MYSPPAGRRANDSPGAAALPSSVSDGKWVLAAGGPVLIGFAKPHQKGHKALHLLSQVIRACRWI
jgi:hypothetical protein